MRIFHECVGRWDGGDACQERVQQNNNNLSFKEKYIQHVACPYTECCRLQSEGKEYPWDRKNISYCKAIMIMIIFNKSILNYDDFG